MTSVYVSKSPSGGRFDFDDGGTYCGGWEDGKAHGHGVCTGPKGQGEYSGAWSRGFEVSGVYSWPTGSTYEGQWADGKRHGLGVETRGRWIYRGEWTTGFKGRYGVRQSITSAAKYDGTWQNGLQDGYGSETYADGGTFQGQWAKGMRHGYGVRSSAPFGLAAHTKRQSVRRSPSLTTEGMPMRDSRPEDSRGGFVLKDLRNTGTWGRSLDHPKESTFRGLLSKPKLRRSLENLSHGGSEGPSDGSDATDSSFVSQDEAIDANVIETYMGEWKNDKRCGFGIAERSDGIKYEGEWYNNKKFGYGLTTFKNGIEEHGKYKNNVLLMSGGKRHLFMLRSAKFRDRVEAAVNGAHRASQIALQKADIAISRTATARGKAEQADQIAKHGREDSEIARMIARQFAPEFQQPGVKLSIRKLASSRDSTDFGYLQVREDLPHHRSKSLYVGNPGGTDPFGSSRDINVNFEDIKPIPEVSGPPAQTALLDVFRNNPDRRPSAAGFLRRPSTINFRRPSTVVELKLVPSTIEQRSEYIPHNPSSYQYVPPLSLQQVVDEHFGHYYTASLEPPKRTRTPHVPIVDFSELSRIYGIKMEDDEGSPIFPQRRSTLPTVLDANNVSLQPETEPSWGGEGVIRTGSLYSATRKMEGASKGSTTSARKNSLPDITNIGGSEPRVLTRETIAILSSQRREAIRRQQEEDDRLRANPLLYLVNPDLWDWISSQQLVIFVVFINLGLAFLFYKVLL